MPPVYFSLEEVPWAAEKHGSREPLPATRLPHSPRPTLPFAAAPAAGMVVCAGQAFPVLRHQFGTQVVFGGFAAMCGLCWLYVNRFVPETRGASLEDLTEGKGDQGPAAPA